MKMLKTFPLLIVFMGLIPSCRCPEVDLYYKPIEMTIAPVWNSSLYESFEDLVIEEAEGFELWLSFSKKEFISESIPTFSFTNQLMATQPCPEDGELGLKSKVESVNITSSEIFREVAAGESINEFFHVLEYDSESEDGAPEYLEVELGNVVKMINTSYVHFSEIPLMLSELPENSLTHSFTVELAFENGTTISGTTSGVQF